jgi:hypothetical protein
MKSYVGVEVHFHAFLNSALEGGEFWASCSGRFTLYWLERRFVGHKADLDTVAKQMNPCYAENQPDRPRRSLITTLTELYWLHLLIYASKNLNDVSKNKN